jgi:hypothetical protein
MYINDVSAVTGWQQFLSLLSRHWGYFILYGILVFILFFFTMLVIVAAGFLTCCIGFLFLVIPYISSVVLLPVSTFFRSFSLEFLEQFGPEYKIFPEVASE